MVANHGDFLAAIFPGSNSHLLMDQTVDTNFCLRMDHNTVRVRKK